MQEIFLGALVACAGFLFRFRLIKGDIYCGRHGPHENDNATIQNMDRCEGCQGLHALPWLTRPRLGVNP